MRCVDIKNKESKRLGLSETRKLIVDRRSGVSMERLRSDAINEMSVSRHREAREGTFRVELIKV